MALTLDDAIKKHKYKHDVDGTLDKSYGKEYLAKHNVTTHVDKDTIYADTRLRKLFQIILEEGIAVGATDILIRPELRYGLVSNRVGRTMMPSRLIHIGAVESLITYIRMLVETNPESTKKGVSAKYTFHKEIKDDNDNITYEKYDTRLQFQPSKYGSVVDIRIFYNENLNKDIDDLGFPDLITYHYKQALKLREGLIIVSGPTGSGKALDINTDIPMFEGGFKKLKDIVIGDYIIDSNGEKTKVLNIFNHVDNDVFKITFSDGLEVLADSDHNWFVYDRNSRISEVYNREKNLNKVREPNFDNETMYKIDLLLKKTLKTDTISVLELSRQLNITRGVIDRLVKINNFELIGSKPKYINKFQILTALRNHGYKNKYDQRKNLVKPKVLTTLQMYNSGVKYVNKKGLVTEYNNYSVKNINSPVKYDKKHTEIPPYMLGVWLGDGHSSASRISGIDEEIFNNLENLGYSISSRGYQTVYIGDYKNETTLYNQLKCSNLFGNKHIPNNYLYNDVEGRKELLSGLLDTDGSVNHKGLVEYYTSSKTLMKQVKQLIESLGYKTTVNSKIQRYKNPKSEYIECKELYTISFKANSLVFKLNRKNEKLKEFIDKYQGDEHLHRYITKIEKVESIPTKCLTVDSKDHLFLCTKSYLPTHNTTTEYVGILQILHDSEFTSNIWTIEEPIEYKIDGITQSEVDELHGYTFADGVKSALRMNPDVMLVGEVRDDETAKTVTRASTSGHLALTTIHANSTLEVLDVLKQYNVHKNDIVNAVRLIIFQTLEDKLCPHCRKQKILKPHQKNWLDRKLIGKEQLSTIYERDHNGCEYCNYSGISGRVILNEMLVTGFEFRVLQELSNGNIDKLKSDLMNSEDKLFYPIEWDVHRRIKDGEIDFESATRLIH